MQPTRLYLIRHGQSAGNAEGRFGGHGPTPLSDLGRRQAEMTANILAKEGIAAIYSSDLQRAVETAEPLAKLLDLPIHQSPAFRERHVGVLEGLTFDESKAAYPKDYYALVNRNIHHVITKGESYRHLLRRITLKVNEGNSCPPGRASCHLFTHWCDLLFNAPTFGCDPSRHSADALANNFKLRYQSL
ncbi:MAG: histidine phosphatase family protein [Chloracidobacterium sp.]|nr:histidine phosphatase family protein [Chloracidobacterium sp.]